MKKFILFFREVFESLIIAGAVVVIVRTFIAQPFLVSGSSMEPNFHNGDYLLIDELTYRFRKPLRGEVIVFSYPQNPSSYFIKRIIGLPNEKVIIEKGVIKIKNQEGLFVLQEDYITHKPQVDYFEKDLGPDEYFVMGDNRNFSYDSRNWGPLKEKFIIGLVRLRLWPPKGVMAFTPPVYELK